MPLRAVRTLATLIGLGVFAPNLTAAEVVGRVSNGTTGQPLPGHFVNLLALRGQMVPVRETQTDAEGRYRFVVAANPSERFLVQVPFQGVTYSQSATFSSGERITADIEVFEAGAQPEDVTVQAQTIFLEPRSSHVRVNEFYSVRNHSQPPRTFAPEGGSFRFALPGAVGDLQVSAGRAGGVPLRQQPQSTQTENVFAIAYALKPGETEVQVSYVLPLTGTSLDLRLPLSGPAQRRHIAVPKVGVQVEGEGLTEIEQTQVPAARIYAVETGRRREVSLRLEVDPAALEAPAPAPAGGAPAASESTVEIVPHPVNRAGWYIAGLTLVVLSLGLYYLYSLRPAPRTVDESAAQRKGARAD